MPRFHVQHEQAVVALLRCTHNELWCAHMQSLRNRPKAADMDHWLATGQLLLDGGVLVTANVYLSAPVALQDPTGAAECPQATLLCPLSMFRASPRRRLPPAGLAFTIHTFFR